MNLLKHIYILVLTLVGSRVLSLPLHTGEATTVRQDHHNDDVCRRPTDRVEHGPTHRTIANQIHLT